jgi:hypothetical protein
MLSPKIIETRRGSAHCEPVDRHTPARSHDTDVRLVKALAKSIRRSHVGQPRNSAL